MNSGTPTININIQQPAQPAPPVAQPFPVPYQPIVPAVYPPVLPVVQPVVPVVQPIAIEQQPPPLHTVTRPTSEPPCCPFSCCCF